MSDITDLEIRSLFYIWKPSVFRSSTFSAAKNNHNVSTVLPAATWRGHRRRAGFSQLYHQNKEGECLGKAWRMRTSPADES